MVTVFTSLSTGFSLDQNRQTVPFTATFNVTSTVAANAPAASGNNTNATTTSTSTGPLPTAPTDVNGGGNGAGGAPSPGATGDGGIYGPPDGYVSGVPSLQWNAMVVGIAGAVVGAILPLL